MDFTFVQTNAGEEQTFQYGRRNSDSRVIKLKAYDVHVDGAKIGSIHQGLATFDRAPRGSRIVTSRTSSPRWWVDTPSGGTYYRGHYETRKSAAESLAKQVRVLNELKETLAWVDQWLTTLNPDGFQETLELIRSDKQAQYKARLVRELTDHLAHPSLDKLRQIA